MEEVAAISQNLLLSFLLFYLLHAAQSRHFLSPPSSVNRILMQISANILLLVLCAASSLAAPRGWGFDEGFCPFLNEYHCSSDDSGTTDLEETRDRISSAMKSVESFFTEELDLAQEMFNDIQVTIKHKKCEFNATDCSPFHPWNDCTEGPVAAPDSHTVLNTTSQVSVLLVQVLPEIKEPFHTHSLSSIMITDVKGDSGCGQKYYDEHNEVLFEQPSHDPDPDAMMHIQFMSPEWFHSIENTGGCACWH